MSADGAAPKVVEMKSTGGATTASAATKPETAPAPRRGGRRYVIMAAVPAIILVIGGWLWLTGGRYVSTDDAYVQQDRVAITAQVAGTIVEVDVGSNQPVKKGDLLFRIDPAPYQIAVEGATAALASARLQVDQLRSDYEQAKTEEKSAADDVAFKQKTYDRQQGLLAKGISSQASFDAAENDLHTAQQTLANAKQHTQAALAALGGNPDITTDMHPLVLAALAKRDQAALDLKNTSVFAPTDGVVTQTTSLQVGQYVTSPAAMPTVVLGLVKTDDTWVDANFKETDLGNIKPGQKATISVDAFPGQSFQGEVASIGAGTGAEFALLPAQNATGNWVKVVQRVPVRVRFTSPIADTPLRSGLTASVEVDTGASHSRLSFLGGTADASPDSAKP